MNLGIFFSKCDGIVGTSLDLESLAKAYEDFSSVKIFDNFYNTDDFDSLLSEVEKKSLDALILAGDSPLTYRHRRNGGHIFKRLSEKGVNRNRIELVNLKNMVAMPHQATQEELQLKAKLLTDMAIERVICSREVSSVEISPRKSVAVIGANLSSIAASQLFLDEGYKVYLIHEGNRIHLNHEESVHIRPTLAYLLHHPRFFMFNEALVKDFYGFTGDYTLKVSSKEKDTILSVGAVVLSLENDHKLIRASQLTFYTDIDEEGFLLPRDEISARSHTENRGIFIIKSSENGQNEISHKFLAADAAAAMVINLLNKKELFHRVTMSQVNTDLCSGCGACMKACVFNAVSFQGDPLVPVIDPRRCRGCGNCVIACPANAIDLLVCPNNYLFNAVDILAQFKPKDNAPLVLAIACNGYGYQSLDQAGKLGLTWAVGVMPLWVVCGCQIDMQLVMHAFFRGFDGVVMLICGEGCCHNIIGNVELERRVNLFREILASRGIDHRRVHIISTCSRKGDHCVESINQFYEELRGKRAESRD